MTQSYKQIQKQIEALQRQADKLREQEVVGVIARIKIAVAHYGLTAQQLGLASGGGAVAKSRLFKAKKGNAARSAKYADGQGNEWSGRGPRPHWLRDALSAGKTLEEFAVAGAAAAAAEPATVATKKRASAKPAGKKRKSVVLYRDQSGNSWSGMGPRPRWLKEALEAGRTLEELTAG